MAEKSVAELHGGHLVGRPAEVAENSTEAITSSNRAMASDDAIDTLSMVMGGQVPRGVLRAVMVLSDNQLARRR